MQTTSSTASSRPRSVAHGGAERHRDDPQVFAAAAGARSGARDQGAPPAASPPPARPCCHGQARSSPARCTGCGFARSFTLAAVFFDRHRLARGFLAGSRFFSHRPAPRLRRLVGQLPVTGLADRLALPQVLLLEPADAVAAVGAGGLGLVRGFGRPFGRAGLAAAPAALPAPTCSRAETICSASGCVDWPHSGQVISLLRCFGCTAIRCPHRSHLNLRMAAISLAAPSASYCNDVGLSAVPEIGDSIDDPIGIPFYPLTPPIATRTRPLKGNPVALSHTSVAYRCARVSPASPARWRAHIS